MFVRPIFDREIVTPIFIEKFVVVMTPGNVIT